MKNVTFICNTVATTVKSIILLLAKITMLNKLIDGFKKKDNRRRKKNILLSIKYHNEINK